MASFARTFERLTETNGNIERDIYALIEQAHTMMNDSAEESEVKNVVDKIFARIRDLRDRFHYDERQMSEKFSERIHDLLGKAQGRRMSIYLPEDEPRKPRWQDMLPRRPHV